MLLKLAPLLLILLNFGHAFQMLFLREYFQHIPIKIDHNEGNSLVAFFFNPAEYTVKEMRHLVTQIFSTLKEKGLAANFETFFLSKLEEYFVDLDANFPAKETCVYEFCHSAKPVITQSKDKRAEELYVAVRNGEKDRVWRLMQLGHDPNTDYEDTTIVTTAVDRAINSADDKSDYIAIMIALLIYGADPNKPSGSVKVTTFDVLAHIAFQYSRFYSVCCALMYCLTASKFARLHLQVHPSDHSQYATLFRASNHQIATRNTRITPLYNAVNVIDAETLVITAKDGTELEIHAVSITDLSMQTEIFNLFKKYYPWQKMLTEAELPEFFYKNFVKKDKEIYVDLVSIKGEKGGWVGFNIAQINNKNINGQDVTLHRILLALAAPALKPYRRLMSIASFKRGFILQEQNRKTRVVTSFEAAADVGYIQIRELENLFPLILHDFIPLIRAFYADESLEGDIPPFYIPDELAYQLKQDSSGWLLSATLALKFYYEFLAKPGKSFIIAFDNNAKNLEKLAESIDPLLDESAPKFKEMIYKASNKKSMTFR